MYIKGLYYVHCLLTFTHALASHTNLPSLCQYRSIFFSQKYTSSYDHVHCIHLHVHVSYMYIVKRFMFIVCHIHVHCSYFDVVCMPCDMYIAFTMIFTASLVELHYITHIPSPHTIKLSPV